MLTWVGKRPLSTVKAYPAQLVESFSAATRAFENCEAYQSDWPDKFEAGGLLFHGDNKDVLAHLLANGFRGKVKLIYIDPPFDSGADYVRKVQLRGTNGTTKVDGEEYTLGEQIQYEDIWANDNYLQFMYERLMLLRELLSNEGSIVLHCDNKRSHFLRMLLDEVMGSEKHFKNELIWFYRRWPTNTPSFQSMHDNLFWYTKSNDNSHTFNKLYEQSSERTLSDYGGKRLTTVETEDGSFVKRETEEVSLGVPMRDVWEIRREHTRSSEHTDYPTQKPLELIGRLITSLSNEGDLILDCFVGSGTTCISAQKLGRRWIGCDINKGAIQTTAKRLHKVMLEQAKAIDEDRQSKLVEDENTPLVKIIPFNHPLSPLDLDDLRKEIERRPEEERDITIVCLGLELKARAWVEDYNRTRPINKINIIELRSDRKYGGFIKHEPLVASVSIKRHKNKLKVTINDVYSPSIVQRLNMDDGLFLPRSNR